MKSLVFIQAFFLIITINVNIINTRSINRRYTTTNEEKQTGNENNLMQGIGCKPECASCPANMRICFQKHNCKNTRASNNDAANEDCESKCVKCSEKTHQICWISGNCNIEQIIELPDNNISPVNHTEKLQIINIYTSKNTNIDIFADSADKKAKERKSNEQKTININFGDDDKKRENYTMILNSNEITIINDNNKNKENEPSTEKQQSFKPSTKSIENSTPVNSNNSLPDSSSQPASNKSFYHSHSNSDENYSSYSVEKVPNPILKSRKFALKSLALKEPNLNNLNESYENVKFNSESLSTGVFSDEKNLTPSNSIESECLLNESNSLLDENSSINLMLTPKTKRMHASSKFKEYERLVKQVLTGRNLSKGDWNQIDLSDSTEEKFSPNVTTKTKPNSELNESDYSSASETNKSDGEEMATQKSKPDLNEMDDVSETEESFETGINKLINETIFLSESKESIEDITTIRPNTKTETTGSDSEIVDYYEDITTSKPKNETKTTNSDSAQTNEDKSNTDPKKDYEGIMSSKPTEQTTMAIPKDDQIKADNEISEEEDCEENDDED
ncbi:probable serine/threonine-protein kinase DDB_G0283337 [Chrysoperla carnea]|uniref:probable serine/threonine-protein kinase DDB_G0283337 n=1 Tax=Chrysoperla carnea TaxID=189513 RepID=UPI001D079B47|nr:probable serine/threonine-protein kinase DDB_G0283337 [Chrysoperla carnea]